jgi:hypothetical protein
VCVPYAGRLSQTRGTRPLTPSRQKVDEGEKKGYSLRTICARLRSTLSIISDHASSLACFWDAPSGLPLGGWVEGAAGRADVEANRGAGLAASDLGRALAAFFTTVDDMLEVDSSRVRLRRGKTWLDEGDRQDPDGARQDDENLSLEMSSWIRTILQS